MNTKEIEKIHWRHIVQSVILFACFCVLDAKKTADGVWLFSALAVVAAIFVALLTAGKIRIGKWSNFFNIIASLFCLLCNFSEVFFPFAIFFVTLCMGVRIIFARQQLNDFLVTIFIITSVLLGILIRFALLLLPLWSLCPLILAAAANPVCKKEICPKGKQNKLIIAIIVALSLFFLCIKIFGRVLTDEVFESFPRNINFAYIAGYILFIAAVLIFRIKLTSIAVLSLSIFGLFVFLLPTAKIFGIYFLLFLGGGIEVMVIIMPISLLENKYHGAIFGLLIYRFAFFASGVLDAVTKSENTISSGFTYTFAAINILFGMTLVFLLIYLDRQQLKAEMGKTMIEIPIAQKPLPDDLSEQEKRVAELILKGKTYRQIADELGVSFGTIAKYSGRIFIKAGVEGQKEFIAYFMSKN